MKKAALLGMALLLFGIQSVPAAAQETQPPAGQGIFADEPMTNPAETKMPEAPEVPDASVPTSSQSTDPDGAADMAGYSYGTPYKPYDNAKYTLYYTVSDGHASITRCMSDTSEENWGRLVIPNEIEGLPVTDIAFAAFSSCTGLTGDLKLPDGITKIGTNAFFMCSGLTGDLTLPGSLTEIGNGAFRDCSGLTGSLTLPAGITKVGDSTFFNCSGLNGRLSLSDGLTEIGAYAFYNCSGLTGGLSLPNSLTSVGDLAFYDCSGLNGRLSLSDALTEIGTYAFYNCGGLTGSLSLSDSLTSIGDSAFYNCSGLTGSLSLPGSLTSIGESAFYNCRLLTDIVVPGSISSIPEAAFYGCDSVINISIPKSLSSIGAFAFFGCCGLTHVYYEGSQEQWDAVNISPEGNDELYAATLHTESYYATNAMPPAFANCDNPVKVLKPYDSNAPLQSYNQGDNAYTTYGRTVRSYLYDRGNGFTRVESDYDGSVKIENYDTAFRFQSGWTLDPELPIWGGFYAGEKYNFLIFGQTNPNEDDSVEVIRVVKYDKDWNRLNSASLRGANTTVPFDAGSMRCSEYGGMLYIQICHQMYTSSDGLRHQSNLSLSVREADMRIMKHFCAVNNITSGYVSHSFNQFILTDSDQNIVTLDHGDGYPRSAVIMRYSLKPGQNPIYNPELASVNLFTFPGETGDNFTGASLGGLAETEDGYIAAFNYSPEDTYDGIRKIHISYLPKDSFAQESVSIWTDPSATGTTPVLAPAGLDGGYVLWESPDGSGSVHYVRYDAKGNVSQIRSCGNVMLSDCRPIYCQGRAIWYATRDSAPIFYALDESGISVYDGSGQPAPDQPNIEQVSSFVSRMYTVALDREAEQKGLDDWTNRLLTHQTDGAGIAHGFIMSDEFKNKNLPDETYVDILYRTFFDREADPDGKTTWTEALSNGNSRDFVLAGFVNSVEFDNLCVSFGITRGTMANGEKAIGPGVRQFVNRCYLKVLSREGEPAGISDWTSRIARGEETPESVAKLFFFSEEYANKNTGDEDFVETLYQTFMDRASDPAGKSDWLGRLSNGASREEVLEGFSRSQEFAGILQSFGL